MRLAQIRKTDDDGRQLPVDEEGDQIAGKDRPHRRTDIDHRRDVLHGVLDVERVDRGQEGREVEDVAEDQAQAVDPDDRELVIEEPHLVQHTRIERQELQEARDRQRHRQPRLPALRQERDEERPDDEDEPGGHDLNHRSSPRAATGIDGGSCR